MTGGPPVREAGWFTLDVGAPASGQSVERLLGALVATIREEVPALDVGAALSNGARLRFAESGAARRFQGALSAENIDATLDGSVIELRVASWYTPADVESIALAVAKVAHYLGVEG